MSKTGRKSPASAAPTIAVRVPVAVVPLAGDPLTDARGRRDLHAVLPAASVYGRFARRAVRPNDGDAKGHQMAADVQVTAPQYVAEALDRMAVRDPLEEQLVALAAVTYARALKLADMAGQQTGIEQLQATSELADAAANTHRRLMLALAEYRNPKKAPTFVRGRQVNVAADGGQQVIQQRNHRNGNSDQDATNEKDRPVVRSGGSVPAGPPSLLPDARGPGVPPCGGPPQPAVAQADAGRTEAVGHERLEARRAVGRGGRAAAGGGGPVSTGPTRGRRAGRPATGPVTRPAVPGGGEG